MDTQSYMYQVTIADPLNRGWTHQHIKAALTENFTTLIYFCMADEQGSCYHTHIFVIFSSRVRFSKIQRCFKDSHIEPCKGSVTDNINYILKEGKWKDNTNKQATVVKGSFEEYGTRPPDSTGRRKDMTALYNMISAGMTNAEIISQNQDYGYHIDKIDRLRSTIMGEKYSNIPRYGLEVTYIYGPTGTGKTDSVLQAYCYNNVCRITDYSHPFDKYSGQDVIMFDNFRSSLPLHEMLTYCDIYPVDLPCRYANKPACYTKIFIVSNMSLEDQYSNVKKHNPESWEAFLRRINKVVVHITTNNIIEYNSIDAYLNRKKT